MNATITLQAEPVDGGVRLEVIGLSDLEYQAAFSLEVTDQKGNHALHRGAARLEVGHRAVLSTMTLGDTSGIWRARLRVEPDGGKPYELLLSRP